MKLSGLFPFMNMEAIYRFPPIGLIWNLYFPVLCERTLGSTVQEQREGQGTAAKQRMAGVSALPSPPLLWLSLQFT